MKYKNYVKLVCKMVNFKGEGIFVLFNFFLGSELMNI